MQKLDDVTKMQYLDLHMWMMGDILLKADKMSMAHSLELRVPYLDKEVMTDAQQWIVRMAEFLLNLGASDLSILAKEAVRPALGVGSIQPGAVLIILLPAGVLLAALLVLRKRRNS